jgi:hypothetical protein
MMMIDELLLLLLILMIVVDCVPLDESESAAFKLLLKEWNLGASYASALLDCPVRNAQVICYPSDFSNPGKRSRLKFLRAVEHADMNGRTIPSVIGDFKHLTGLSLRGNRLVGSIPREIARCRELTLLDLLGNRLGGRVPPELGAMRDLSVCLLTGMVFDCPIPDLNEACHRSELASNCNDTSVRVAGARLKKGLEWQDNVDKLRHDNLALINQKNIDPNNFNLNDPRLTIEQKRALLKQRQAALAVQQKIVADQLSNLG